MLRIINLCLGCGGRSVTLYCDRCAPPARNFEPKLASLDDRRWNGQPMSATLLGLASAGGTLSRGEDHADHGRHYRYAM